MAKKKKQSRQNRAKKRAQNDAKRKRQKQGQGNTSKYVRQFGCSRTALGSLPIKGAYIAETISEQGFGPVVIARELLDGDIVVGSFLVDSYCLGVKDAFLTVIPAFEFDGFIRAYEIGADVQRVSPERARKLVEDAVAYARDLGFDPHSGYHEATAVFGDIDASECTEMFIFGHDGEPCYAPGPNDSEAMQRHVVKKLHERCGPDSFHGVIRDDFDDEDDFLGGDDLIDEDDDIFDDDEDYSESLGTYDPSKAPDPDEWNGWDDDDRIFLAKQYHRRAGMSEPDARVHSMFHVIVEDQALMPDLPVAETLARLMQKDGLDRHDAIHAVASVVSGHMYDTLAEETPFDEAQYMVDLRNLTAESWRRNCAHGETRGE